MYDLRNNNINNDKNYKKIWYDYLSKIKIKHFLYLILLLIIIYPEISGEMIGNWIHDFFITIINKIKDVG